MRSDYISEEQIELVLAAMMPANRLAILVSLHTGLRISDVLAIKTEQVQKGQRLRVTDSKTGKKHRVWLPKQYRAAMLSQAGKLYVWEHRTDWTKHRNRSTVYKDMVRAAKVYKRSELISQDKTVTPHTARKAAAVRVYHTKGFDAAQQLLMHDPDHPLVTLRYALSDDDKALAALYPKKRRGRKEKGDKANGVL